MTTERNHAPRCFFLGLLLLSASLSPINAQGFFTLTGGQASAGADSATSPSMAAPPPVATLTNVFYSSDSLTALLVNLSGLTAGGWAVSTWNISIGPQTSIYANGSSGQGFNGAYSDGWIYAFGHANFIMDFTLSQNASYVNESSANILLMNSANDQDVDLGNSGILPAGQYTLFASTYGDSGGYDVNLVLVPEPSTVALLCLPILYVLTRSKRAAH
jgi:hypothetical protein